MHTVRSGKWKLHLVSPERNPPLPADSNWVDPVWPDGVTIIAENDQPKAHLFPGVRTGVKGAAMLLFDLENDPAEQVDVAAKNPEVVKRLWALSQKATFD